MASNAPNRATAVTSSPRVGSSSSQIGAGDKARRDKASRRFCPADNIRAGSLSAFEGDDAIGPTVIKVFEARYAVPADVAVVDGGTPGLDLTAYRIAQECSRAGPKLSEDADDGPAKTKKSPKNNVATGGMAEIYLARQTGIQGFERMAVVNAAEGVWSCTAVGYCSEVCPKHVDPANAVNQNKVNSAKDYFLRFVAPKGAGT